MPGDIGFDPLSLRPESAEEFKVMQTKELQNGRLGKCMSSRVCPVLCAVGYTLYNLYSERGGRGRGTVTEVAVNSTIETRVGTHSHARRRRHTHTRATQHPTQAK